MIEAAGVPSACGVVAAEEGFPFSQVVLRWLRSGQVHDAPAVRDGQAVAQHHQTVEDFLPADVASTQQLVSAKQRRRRRPNERVYKWGAGDRGWC